MSVPLFRLPSNSRQPFVFFSKKLFIHVDFISENAQFFQKKTPVFSLENNKLLLLVILSSELK